MLDRMTPSPKDRLTIVVAPELGAAVRQAAGAGGVSSFGERALRRELLHASLDLYGAAGALDIQDDLDSTADLDDDLDRREGSAAA